MTFLLLTGNHPEGQDYTAASHDTDPTAVLPACVAPLHTPSVQVFRRNY